LKLNDRLYYPKTNQIQENVAGLNSPAIQIKAGLKLNLYVAFMKSYNAIKRTDFGKVTNME